MRQFSIQFHATRAELVLLLCRWMGDGLFLVAERGGPYRVSPVLTEADVGGEFDDPAVWCVTVLSNPPVFLSSSAPLRQLEFYRLNPDRMSLSLGGSGSHPERGACAGGPT
jgi:hypothetical protein